jgi:hypothetical protein
MQSIKITTSTKQKITIDPLSIKIENSAGTLSITMDNKTQSISVKAPKTINLEAAEVSINALTKLDLKSTTINLQSTGPCTVAGTPVKIN